MNRSVASRPRRSPFLALVLSLVLVCLLSPAAHAAALFSGYIAPAQGHYNAGDSIDIGVRYSEPVVVTGNPRLRLTAGSHTLYADYLGGSESDTLTFRYTVTAGIDAPFISVTTLELNGGSIVDLGSEPAGAPITNHYFLAIIDTTPPTVVSLRRCYPLEFNTASGTVVFRAVFNDTVTHATPAAFALLRSGTANATIAWVRGDNADWYVGVTEISGQGTLGLEVRANILADKAGNPIARYTGGERYFCLNGIAPHAWGYGLFGQLGNNANLNSPTPVPLHAVSSSPLSGHTVGQVSAGFNHTIALSRDGLLYAWGRGDLGQIGNGFNHAYNYPEYTTMNAGLAGQRIIATTAGGDHGLALASSGHVFAWGDNSEGQIGRGTLTSFNQPIHVPTADTPMEAKEIVAIAAGYRHSLALDVNGQVYAWGDNAYGQLGNNSTVDSPSPVAVFNSGALDGKRVVAIDAGYWYSAALTSDGQVFTWGLNHLGQLGLGTTVDSRVPVAVTGGAQAGRFAVEIAAGGSHLLVRNRDGVVTAWGSNHHGQLGNSAASTPSTIPVVTNTTPLGSTPIARLSSGDSHSLALTADGRLFAWGYNYAGQLGLGTLSTAPNSIPTLLPSAAPDTAYAIASLHDGGLGNHSLAFFTTRIFASRLNGPAPATYGAGAQLEFHLTYPDTVTVAGSPVLVVGVGTRNAEAQYVAHNGSGVLTFRYTVMPGDYTPAGLTLEAFIGAEGITDRRGLGVNTALPANSDLFGVRIDARAPRALTSKRAQPYALTEAAAQTTASVLIYRVTFDKVVTGVDPSDFALATTGTAAGTISTVLGSGDSRFVVVTGVTGSGAVRLDLKDSGTEISDTFGNPLAGGFSNGQAYIHLGQTSVIAWGPNSLGQIGFDTNGQDVSAPTSVPAQGALQGKTVATLASGAAHTLALCSDGTLAAWGDNHFGQLGCAHPDTSSALPVSVSLGGELSGQTIMAIAAGTEHCLALTSAGRVYAWGRNNSGQLGILGSGDREVPTSVDRLGALANKEVIAIAAGGAHSLALTADGLLFAWGSDDNGQLGNASFGSSSIPTLVDTSGILAGQRLVALAAGRAHSLALDAGGHAYSWGSNSSGQIGNNGHSDVMSPLLVDLSSAIPGNSPIVAALAAGDAHSAVLTSDGKIVTWGANFHRQLGHGSTTSLSRTPVAADIGNLGGAAATAVFSGADHLFVHTAPGALYGWGDNSDYQLSGSLGSTVARPQRLNSGTLAGATVVALPTGGAASHSLVLITTGGDPLSLVEQWRLQHFDTPFSSGSAADAADPDADGRPNFVEYATGTNPTTADSGPVAALATTGTGVNRRLTLTFNRIADPTLVYTVEASTTLAAGSWTTIIPPATPLTGPVTVTDPQFMSSHTRRFLRLRIERRP